MNRDETNEIFINAKIRSSILKDSTERAAFLCFLLSIIFGAYGFTSISFIQKFSPEISLWSNVWPRLLFNTLPLLLLGFFVKKSNTTETKKMSLWIISFPAILHASGWIHIWPIALNGSPEILTYVHGANVFLFAVVYAAVAPPKSYLVGYTISLIATFVTPLFIIAHWSNDQTVFKLVVNDSLLAIFFGCILGAITDSIRSKITRLELEKEAEASKFLGPVVSKAIFENESGRLESIRCQGFIASIDIRDSTELQKKFGPKWLAFRKEYFSLVSQAVTRSNGYIQKTVGDCHVINFGIMDYGADLSDIPGLNEEKQRADEKRLQRASQSTFSCLDEIMQRFGSLSAQHFPELPVGSIRLGAGVDKGWVERGVQGDRDLLELDVNGDPVNCSNRLQDFGKDIRDLFQADSSLLVLSPFASDFLTDLSQFRRIASIDKKVRNFPGIKWVLVREYRQTKANATAA